jgi:Tfp pilus assembly protein PilF
LFPNGQPNTSSAQEHLTENPQSAIRNPQAKNPQARQLPAAILIITLTLALWLGSFVIKQLSATSLIAFGETAESREQAVAYAPGHPAVLAARGKYLLYRAETPDPSAGIAALGRAVQAAPFDYRFWLELGRGYESDGQVAAAERAFQQALQLAPRYFETHWTLANFHLRSGRVEESLQQFRQALELSGEATGAELRQTKTRAALNAFEAITQALGLNFAALRQLTPADGYSQAALAKYLADHQALDPALEIFRALAPQQQLSERAALESLLAAAQAQHRYHEARALWLAFALADDSLIYNGGFEHEFNSLPAGFDWSLPAPHAEARVRRDDAQAHTGRFALRLTFAMQMQSELHSYGQLLVVEPQRQYRLRYFVKTVKAPDRAPYLEITDAAQPQLFALRSPVPAGTNEWREQALVFTTPAETRALRLVIRAPQLLEVNTGNIAEVWLDDFSLELVP